MKKFVLLCAVTVATLLAGCLATSVYPFYTSKDLVFDPAIVGKWILEDDSNEKKVPWQFSRSGEKEYTLVATDDEGETNAYTVHLFKLRGQLFMDWLPTFECDDAIPPHYLFKVEQAQSTLRLKGLHDDWLAALLKKRPEAVRHMVVRTKSDGRTSERIVLTADTKELQKFVIKHLDDPKAFNEEVLMLKRSAIE